jgi:hypothetical protein
MGLPCRISILPVILLSSLAGAYYAHPFMDTVTGSAWEYAYTSSSNVFSMGAASQTSKKLYGNVSLTILDSTGQARITVKGKDSVSVQSLMSGTTVNTVRVYDTSFTVWSITAIALDSFCGFSNPFCIDSLFIGDSLGTKSGFVNSTSSNFQMSFEKAAIQKDTLFLHSIITSRAMLLGDLSSSYRDTTAFLQGYGLIRARSVFAASGTGSQSSNKSFLLTSFNGKAFNGPVVAVDSVPMIDMELLYPAYAVHLSSSALHSSARCSFLSPLFSARRFGSRVELSVFSPRAYTLSIADVLGKTARVVQGDAPVVPLEFAVPGVYMITMRSGGEKQSEILRVW